MPTNNLLATGGMKQQGGTVDPVSGNAVPVGSLQNEVRDDVDAKLSDGEFVFPADVTRYIGLDKLMQIREAAKEGLQKMDSMGQMGNAEEAAENGGDEEQFSSNIDDIISSVDGKEEEVKKFAGGGGVNTTDYSGAPLQGFSMELYEDPKTKVTRYIPFLNGKALLPVPSGYTKKDVSAPAETATTTTTTTPATGADTTGRTGGGGPARDGSTDTTGRTGGEAAPEGFGGLQSGTTGLGKLASMVPGKLGLLVSAANGLFTKVQNEKTAAANAKAVDASALASMGFSATSIKAAQEAAAKATLEGKSAKDIAIAAANAASEGVATGAPKDSLDALLGITNAFNTMSNQQATDNAKEVAINKSLVDAGLSGAVPTDMWGMVVSGIESGLTPQQAIQNAETAADKDAAAANMAAAAKEARDAQVAQDARDAAEAEATRQQDAREAEERVSAAKEARDAQDAKDAAAAEATRQQDAREVAERVSAAQDARDAAAAEATRQQDARAAAEAAAAVAAETRSTGNTFSSDRYSGDNSGDNRGWGSRDAG